MTKTKISSLIWWSLGLVLAIVWLLPLVWVLISTLKPYGHPIANITKVFEGDWTLSNFAKLFNHGLYKYWLLNSVVVSIVQTILNMAIAIITAYVFSQMKFKGKNIILFLMIISFLIPGEALTIPLFKQVVINMKLGNDFLGIILPGLTNLFAIFVLKAFFDEIPISYREAAMIDGASHWHILKSIYLPMSIGIISTLTILAFIGTWNSFMWPLLVMSNDKMFTLPVGLPQFLDSQVALDLTLPMTANLIAALPTIICFLVFQKQITESTMAAGIKQ